jgi:zinc protease
VIGYYDLPLTYLNDFRQQIAKVTLADIKSAFKRRLNPKSFVTVVVGSAQQE